METRNSFKSNRIILVLLAVVIIMTTMACNMGGINIYKNKAVIDVNLTQDQMNMFFQNTEGDVRVSDSRILEKITGVEMHDGFMRVFGENKQSDGTYVPGSFDISIGAADDELKVQITAVDISGITLDDPRIVDANAELARELSQSVREANGDVLYKEASVSEAGLKLKMEVRLSK
jgi:hypothetical protein